MIKERAIDMTKERYIIAVDMDGTLLNSKGKITENTMTTLKSLLEAGHYIVPASGRAFPILPEEIKTLSGIQYAVLENGAVVWDWKKQTPISVSLLPKGVAQKILQQVKAEYPQERYYTELIAGGMAYAEENDRPYYQDATIEGDFVAYMLKEHTFVAGIHNRTDILQRAEKINLYFENSAVSEGIKKEWRKRSDVGVTSSVRGNVEFMSPTASKGEGLAKLSGLLGIDRNHIIAIGDNENDVEMFDVAGISVAMGNASDAIKNKAVHVTEDHDHDGAAVFLQKYFKMF